MAKAKKMKRKIKYLTGALCLLMIATLLSGCISKTNFMLTCNEISNLNAFDFNAELSLSKSEDSEKFAVSGTIYDSEKVTADLTIKVVNSSENNSSGSSDVEIPLKIVDGNRLYFDVNALMGLVLSSESNDSEPQWVYYDLSSLEDQTSIEFKPDAVTSDLTDKSVSEIITVLDECIQNADVNAYSEDNGSYIFSLNQDQIKKIIASMQSFMQNDYDARFDKFVDSLTLDTDKETVKDSKEELKDNLNSTLDELSQEIPDDISIIASVRKTDGSLPKYDINAKIEGSVDGETTKCELLSSFTKIENKQIEIPENAQSFENFQKSMYSSSYNSSDYTNYTAA